MTKNRAGAALRLCQSALFSLLRACTGSRRGLLLGNNRSRLLRRSGQRLKPDQSERKRSIASPYKCCARLDRPGRKYESPWFAPIHVPSTPTLVVALSLPITMPGCRHIVWTTYTSAFPSCSFGDGGWSLTVLTSHPALLEPHPPPFRSSEYSACVKIGSPRRSATNKNFSMSSAKFDILNGA